MKSLSPCLKDSPASAESVFPIAELDPLNDPRWAEFVAKHPQACAFHSAGWLRALKVSYEYDPFVLTTARPGEALEDGLVCCRVRSWLTGPRIVSLPFSDHCHPLVRDATDLALLLQHLRQYREAGDWKFVEVRPFPGGSPSMPPGAGFTGKAGYCFHVLDLRPSLGEILAGFHKNCVRRVIKRAEREQLTVEEGRSENLLRVFYSLMVLTRRRHEIPPQPIWWFRNLLGCMGPQASIRVALKDGKPIASILTLSHSRTVIYKYGCSDTAYHNLGGMVFLFWRAIQDAKQSGAEYFDFGRSDLDNPGLIAFKDHFGAQSSHLAYYRYPGDSLVGREGRWATRFVGKALALMPNRFSSKLVHKVISVLPNRILSIAGSVLYRHIG